MPPSRPRRRAAAGPDQIGHRARPRCRRLEPRKGRIHSRNRSNSESMRLIWRPAGRSGNRRCGLRQGRRHDRHRQGEEYQRAKVFVHADLSFGVFRATGSRADRGPMRERNGHDARRAIRARPVEPKPADARAGVNGRSISRFGPPGNGARSPQGARDAGGLPFSMIWTVRDARAVWPGRLREDPGRVPYRSRTTDVSMSTSVVTLSLAAGSGPRPSANARSSRRAASSIDGRA